MLARLFTIVLVVAAAESVSAATSRGDWSDAYAGRTGRLRFLGRLDPAAGVVRGRLVCGPRCPVRGRFRPTCGPLAANSRECAGPVGRASAGCTASGFVYLRVFEGTWECGPGRGGALSFGSR